MMFAIFFYCALKRISLIYRKVCDFKNDFGKFAIIKSIHGGLSELLKRVGSFIKLCR